MHITARLTPVLVSALSLGALAACSSSPPAPTYGGLPVKDVGAVLEQVDAAWKSTLENTSDTRLVRLGQDARCYLGYTEADKARVGDGVAWCGPLRVAGSKETTFDRVALDVGTSENAKDATLGASPSDAVPTSEVPGVQLYGPGGATPSLEEQIDLPDPIVAELGEALDARGTLVGYAETASIPAPDGSVWSVSAPKLVDRAGTDIRPIVAPEGAQIVAYQVTQTGEASVRKKNAGLVGALGNEIDAPTFSLADGGTDFPITPGETGLVVVPADPAPTVAMVLPGGSISVTQDGTLGGDVFKAWTFEESTSIFGEDMFIVTDDCQESLGCGGGFDVRGWTSTWADGAPAGDDMVFMHLEYDSRYSIIYDSNYNTTASPSQLTITPEGGEPITVTGERGPLPGESDSGFRFRLTATTPVPLAPSYEVSLTTQYVGEKKSHLSSKDTFDFTATSTATITPKLEISPSTR